MLLEVAPTTLAWRTSRYVAQLSQRNRATIYVSWNLVNYWTTVWKIAFEKACNRWVTLKISQGQQTRHDSIRQFHAIYPTAPACNRNGVVWVVRSHPQSLKIAPFDRVRIYEFLLAFHSNYVPILHRFWGTARYWSKMADFNLPHLYLAPPLG